MEKTLKINTAQTSAVGKVNEFLQGLLEETFTNRTKLSRLRKSCFDGCVHFSFEREISAMPATSFVGSVVITDSEVKLKLATFSPVADDTKESLEKFNQEVMGKFEEFFAVKNKAKEGTCGT